MVRRIARRASLDGAGEISPHSLWVAFITGAREAGAPLEDVQDAAGHADPRTTRRYDRGRHSLGVAFDATFGSSREHAVPAAQRAALRCARPTGTPRGCGDLGLHGPPVSGATMMQLIPLRGLHHHCASPSGRGASGASSPDPASGARPAPQLRGTRRPPHHWPRHASHLATSRSGCTSCIPAPDDGCARGRQLARQPRGTPPGRRAADVAATHRSRRPADAPGLDLRHGWADPYP